MAILICTTGGIAATLYFPGQQGDILNRYGVEDLLRRDIEKAGAVPGPMVERCGAPAPQEIALTNTTYEALLEDPRIDGDLVVWREEDRDPWHHPGVTDIDTVWVMDLRTGKKSQLPFPRSDVNDAPDVSGYLLAYIRQHIPTDRNPAQVYLYNLQTGEERQLSVGSAEKSDVAITGYHVVWIEHGESGPGSVHHYDLVRGTDEVISPVNPSYNTMSVSDDWAAWDEPVSDITGKKQYSIRVYRFSTDSRFPLTDSMPGNQRYPATDGNYVVWANLSPNYNDGIPDSIVIYSIPEDRVVRTIGSQHDPGPPAISGNRVIWDGTIYDIGMDSLTEADIHSIKIADELYPTFEFQAGPLDIAGDRVVSTRKNPTAWKGTEHQMEIFLYNLTPSPSRLCHTRARFDAKPEDGPVPLTVTFEGIGSSSPQGAITSFHWNIWDIYRGAGAPDLPVPPDQANVTVTFTHPGVYMAQLRVEDRLGDFNYSEKYIVAMSPDEGRLTRDPKWDAVAVDMHNGYLCWWETYKAGVSSIHEYKTNPDLAYSSSRTVLYSPSTGVRTIFSGMHCVLGDGVMAYHLIPQNPEDPDRFRILSLPSMATTRDLTVGHGRLWGISGKRVFWEAQNPLSLYYHWPLTPDSPWTKCAATNCAMTSDIMSYDAGYSIAGVSLPAVNLTNDPHDNNFPRMSGDTVVWVDYANIRTWPTVDPVLWAYNLTSSHKFSIPTNAIQISADIYGDRIVWIQNSNDANKRDITALPWTTTLHEYSLTTGTQRLLKTFPNNVHPRMMSVFGDRIIWVIENDLWMFDAATQKEKQVTYDGRFSGLGFIHQECDFAVYSSDRGGQFDIYIMKLPYPSATRPDECEPPGKPVMYSFPPPTPAPPRPGPGEETPAERGGGFLGWLLGIFRISRPGTPAVTATPLDIRLAEHLCNDGDACPENDRWAYDVCTGGTAPVCIDNNPDTADTCDRTRGCVFTPLSVRPGDESPCDDGNACTFGEFFRNGICTGGAPVVCDDHNPGTADSCTPSVGCVFTPGAPGPKDYSPCDDGNACTFGEYFLNGICNGGAPVVCDDNNPGTTDSCIPPSGCVFAPVSMGPADDSPCDDGNACTFGEFFRNGICTGGAAVICDDGNPGTTDSCEPGHGCIHTAMGEGEPCAEPCACMFEYEARDRFGAYVRCSDIPCSSDYSRISAVAYRYCYRSASQGGGTVVLVRK